MSNKFAKFSVLLATPTVELPLAVKDARGDSTTIHVGYKRYNEEEAKARVVVFDEIRAPLTDLMERKKNGEQIEVSLMKQVEEEVEEKVVEFLQSEITHFRNIQLMDANGAKSILVKDSRIHEVNFWTEVGCSSCTMFLKEFLFTFGNYKSALTQGFFSALSNRKASDEAESKN